MVSPVYKRILLKYSGEALAGNADYNIDLKVLDKLAADIGILLQYKVQVGLVIGGGNLFRGEELSSAGVGRISADHMGMLATLMNALVLRDSFERSGYPTRIMSAIPMSGIVDHYDRRKAIHHLESGRLVIFAAGTGNPLVTTDSAASLRAIEVGADVLIKATQVDGVYSADPSLDKRAVKFDRLSYADVLSKELAVMDLVAFSQCRDHNMPIVVFNLNKNGALLKIIMGEAEGTVVN